jgi:hypothetical protein
MMSEAFGHAVAAVSVSRQTSMLTISSTPVRALLAITFFYPVVLCAIFFPTPASDLREHINLGLSLPLYVWNSPPLQTWTAGLIALTGARDAWLFVLVAQILNFIGLFKLVQTTKKFISPEAAVPLVIMYCGSIYYSAATPTMALNADQIQVPIWAGCLYHALSAARDNRWRDWLLTGVLLGVAFLAKYSSAVILAVLLAVAFWLPAYRGIFRNIRFYVSGILAFAITLIHLIPELLYANVLQYGVTRFDFNATLSIRAMSAWHLVRSFLFYGFPMLIGLAVLARHRDVGRPRMPRDPAQRFIVLTAIGTFIAMLLMIVIGGLDYSTRYTFAFYGFSLLALLSVISIEPRGLRNYANVTLMIWGGIVIGTLVYTQVFINRGLREPAHAAAPMLSEAWVRQFSCGPAYVLGDDRTVRAIAIYFGRPVLGVRLNDIDVPIWLDKDRLRRLGAIVITSPGTLDAGMSDQWFLGRTLTTITLPYRRTLRTDQHTYQYYFIPPQGC